MPAQCGTIVARAPGAPLTSSLARSTSSQKLSTRPLVAVMDSARPQAATPMVASASSTVTHLSSLPAA